MKRLTNPVYYPFFSQSGIPLPVFRCILFIYITLYENCNFSYGRLVYRISFHCRLCLIHFPATDVNLKINFLSRDVAGMSENTRLLSVWNNCRSSWSWLWESDKPCCDSYPSREGGSSRSHYSGYQTFFRLPHVRCNIQSLPFRWIDGRWSGYNGK